MAAPTPVLVQSASNSVRKRGAGDCGSTTVKVTFDAPSTPGNLIIAVAFATGGMPITVRLSDSGYTSLASGALRDTQLGAWYRQAAPATTSVTATADSYRGMTVRIYEYRWAAQSNALDKVAIRAGEDSCPTSSGTLGTLAGAGELVFAVIASQYASTRQSGFTGGLTRIFEDVVPGDDCEDWERGRITTHQATAASTDRQKVTGSLSSERRWISFVAAFKTGALGPARFTVTHQTRALTTDVARGRLTVFGPLKVTFTVNRSAVPAMAAVRARIGPCNYQYLIGGWSGLTIGKNTPYPVESVEGLEGWTVRTSDDDLPREDGGRRGVDLQAARQILFKLSAPSLSGDRSAVEALLTALYKSLGMQRDTDVELIWRHPGQPLKSMYYRPTELVRQLNLENALTAKQAFALRAVDPRHYSAVTRSIIVPVAGTDGPVVNVVGAANLGNTRAYPVIRVTGPTSGPDVTRVSVFNASADVAFEVQALLQNKGELVGDMRARVVSSGASVITINGASKYGSWQMPRAPFYLAPDPTVAAGVNLLYARTTPTNAPVTVTVSYRDCWSG